MKTTITLIAAVLLLLTTGEDALRAQTDVPPAGARYGVKSAIIKKSFYGPGGDREITIYIDDYGAREAEEDRMGKHQSLRIRNEKDKTEVVVDFSERTVNIGGWESKRQINYRHLKLGELERYGLTEAGTKVLLGKTCRVYKQNTWLKSYMVTVTHYVWEGINLKSDLKYDEVPGWEEREEVKSIQVNVDVPQEKFQIPRGFKVKEWRGR